MAKKDVKINIGGFGCLTIILLIVLGFSFYFNYFDEALEQTLSAIVHRPIVVPNLLSGFLAIVTNYIGVVFSIIAHIIF